VNVASTVRVMRREDLEAAQRLNGGEFPKCFLAMVYERDGEILGWASCRADNGLPVLQAAVGKKMTGFSVMRLGEAMEDYLRRIGIYMYVFAVHVKRKRWIGVLERLGIFERYANKAMHAWFQRRLR